MNSPRSRSMAPSRLNNRAFTLVEIMVTLAIVAVLAGVAMAGYSKWIRHAENAKCLTHMKGIGAALGTYTVDHEGWPQMPEDLGDKEEEEEWKWWIKTMEPYGITQATWLCPTEDKERRRYARKSGEKRDDYEGTYIPTDFDDGRDTPYKWNQPWLIERGNWHGKGQNVLLPDGSIRPFLNPMDKVRTK